MMNLSWSRTTAASLESLGSCVMCTHVNLKHVWVGWKHVSKGMKYAPTTSIIVVNITKCGGRYGRQPFAALLVSLKLLVKVHQIG